jgi:hypothetical protein
LKFQPGNQLGAAGRPRGARNRLAAHVFSDVLEFICEPAAFQPAESTKFRALLLNLWRESPRAFARFLTSILPRELSIESSTVNELTDEELDRMIQMLRARALAAREEQSLDDAADEYVRAGKLRALAVTTSTHSPVLPDIPTVAEFVPGYEASFWTGIGAPRNTPIEIVEKLNQETKAALTDSQMRARLAGFGATALSGSPADFGKLIAAETEKWSKVVKFTGIKAD